jgi:hypothetical protein
MDFNESFIVVIKNPIMSLLWLSLSPKQFHLTIEIINKHVKIVCFSGAAGHKTRFSKVTFSWIGERWAMY